MKTPRKNFLLKVLFVLFFPVCLLLPAFKSNLHADPVAILNHPDKQDFTTGSISVEDFKKSTGVTLVLGDDATLEIARFNMVRVPKNEDPVEIFNYQADYNERSRKLVDRAESGDVFYFERILAKSPELVSEGDWIKLNSMVIKID